MPNDETKNYNVTLIKDANGNILMQFDIDDEKRCLSYADDDINQINDLFMILLERATHHPIHITFEKNGVGKDVPEYYIDATEKYIEQLNSDISKLEEDDDLKEIRNILN